jgi:hypothetical protein
VPVGAVAAATLWYAVGSVFGHLPLILVALAAALLGLVDLGLPPVRLPSSPWRIPRSWVRFGHPAYSAIFGASLGTGLLTALASPALYAMVLWGTAAHAWADAAIVFVGFAVGRVVPVIGIAADAYLRRKAAADPYVIDAALVPLRALEATALLAFALTVLLV